MGIQVAMEYPTFIAWPGGYFCLTGVNIVCTVLHCGIIRGEIISPLIHQFLDLMDLIMWERMESFPFRDEVFPSIHSM